MDAERRREQRRIASATFRRKHPEKIKADNARNYEKNREQILEQKRLWHKKRIQKRGIARARRYEELYEEQGGRCAICAIQMLVSGRTLDVACADHCHKTLRWRGLLCKRCNLMIGIASDEEERLLAAVEYLRKWKGKT